MSWSDVFAERFPDGFATLTTTVDGYEGALSPDAWQIVVSHLTAEEGVGEDGRPEAWGVAWSPLKSADVRFRIEAVSPAGLGLLVTTGEHLDVFLGPWTPQPGEVV